MIVLSVSKNSPAAQIGITPGDQILSINGHKITDILDFNFWYHSSVASIILKIKRDNEIRVYEIDESIAEADSGLQFAELKPRHCGNKCIFCFTDQNPPGMRSSLYFKDEDYRFSFLHGYYVTLTNISRKDLSRIIEQRMSPLYVSVHATDSSLRQKLFGRSRDDGLLEKISLLTRAGIELHTQIVLCPGLNDGQQLFRTVHDLAAYHPNVKSVAVVPVGLTKHRQGLVDIKSFDGISAANVIELVDGWGNRFLQQLGSRFVYLADEFYVLAQKSIPDNSYYDAFDQLENGVGMIRTLLTEMAWQHRYFPAALKKSRKISLVTGELAGPVMNDLIKKFFGNIKNLHIQVVPIRNEFYGEQITVSGLLTGKDIYQQLSGRELADETWLPPNCLNFNDVFLDDWTPQQLEQKLGGKVKVLNRGFLERLKQLAV